MLVSEGQSEDIIYTTYQRLITANNQLNTYVEHHGIQNCVNLLRHVRC